MRQILIGGMLCLAWAAGPSRAAEPPAPFARWEKSIAAFEQQDQQQPPPKNAVLFVGSSSIRLWKLPPSFPNQTTINRGFGGSQLADAVHFADRIVLKHQPRLVVLYAGDNDLAAKKTPQQVAQDFQAFSKVILEKLPRTKILYLSIKPSIKRWSLVEQIKTANALIERQCREHPQLEFVDTFAPMLRKDGHPRPELFAPDGLHLNETGYELWTTLLTPRLVQDANRK